MPIASLDAALNPSTTSLRPEDAEPVNGAAASSARLDDEFNKFMLLLTTQLKNQDPTEPLDTNQMTEQLVQFTGVEQQIQTNTNLEKLVSQNQTSQINNAVSFIGKTVQAEGNQTVLKDSAATLTFDVPSSAQSVSVAVLDGVGKPVFSETIDTQSGLNEFVWDGKSSFTSASLDDGVYTYSVTARDATGEPVDVATYVAEEVTSVSLASGEPVLSLQGEIDLPINRVITVKETENQIAIADENQDNG